MADKPIYRLSSLATFRTDEETKQEYKEQHLCAHIRIPDELRPGDSIHLTFNITYPKGKEPSKNHLYGSVKGGGFIRICDDGKMEFDGT